MKKLSQGPVRRPAGLNSPATPSSAGFVMREVQTGLHKPEGGTKQRLTKSADNSAPVYFPNCASICLGSRVSFDLPLALHVHTTSTLRRSVRVFPLRGGPSSRPTLLRPKEACQATGLGRVRNGQDQDEVPSGAGVKHRVQHRRSSASGAGSIHSCLARCLGREGA